MTMYILAKIKSCSVGFLWMSDQPDALHNIHKTDIHAPAGFKLAIPASEWMQPHALNCMATGINKGIIT
jgi:hypothetical protein